MEKTNNNLSKQNKIPTFKQIFLEETINKIRKLAEKSSWACSHCESNDVFLDLSVGVSSQEEELVLAVQYKFHIYLYNARLLCQTCYKYTPVELPDHQRNQKTNRKNGDIGDD